jgi:hypothetical protein
MTPEEQRLADLLAGLAQRHRLAGGDGRWLDARLRRARLRRGLAAAAASAVAVVALAGGAAVLAQQTSQTASVPATGHTPTPIPSATAGPAARTFVSALALRADGTGAAVVGPCLLGGGACRQLLRLTADGGRVLDPATERPLPVGADAPDVRAVAVAGRHTVYVWGGGLAYSNDDGRTWTSRDVQRQLSDVAVSPDGASVWAATTDCPARPAVTGCPTEIRESRAGADPTAGRRLPFPVSYSGGLRLSRAAGGLGAAAVYMPGTGGAPGPDAVFTTNDDGSTWTRHPSPCQGSNGLSPYGPAPASVAADGTVWVLCAAEGSAGAQRKGVYVSTGTGGFRLTGPLPDRGYAESIAAVSATTAYVSASRGEVSATADGGRTWRQVTGNSDFFGPVQVLPDGSGAAPGQADGTGAVWAGPATGAWKSYPVATPTLPPPPLPTPGPCAQSKLAITAAPVPNGAGGESGILLDIKNDGPGTCTVDGYPDLVFQDAHGKTVAFTIVHGGSQIVTPALPATVAIPMSGHAYVAFGKYRCDQGDQTLPTAVSVRLPGREYPLLVDLTGTRDLAFCGPGDPGSSVAVSPVEPDQASTTSYAPVRFPAGCSDKPIRPTHVALACADGGSITDDLTWTSWTQTQATATGVLTENDCSPSCLNGTKRTYRAGFRFFDVRAGHFTQVEIDFVGTGPGQRRRETRPL